MTETWAALAELSQKRRCARLLTVGHQRAAEQATATELMGSVYLCRACPPATVHVPLSTLYPRCSACGNHHPGAGK